MRYVALTIVTLVILTFAAALAFDELGRGLAEETRRLVWP